MGRRYRLARRAQLVNETRRHIIDAAVELHETLGPARTTISAVAERAGVQRLTVYRHFPDETALFHACTGQWLADHPPPDTARWAACRDPHVRLRRALRELYTYFDRTRAMWERAYRDAPFVPALDEPMAAWLGYLDSARDILAAGWPAGTRDGRRLEIAIGHTLAFSTWASLSALGSSTMMAVSLMMDLVGTVARDAGKPVIGGERQTAYSPLPRTPAARRTRRPPS